MPVLVKEEVKVIEEKVKVKGKWITPEPIFVINYNDLELVACKSSYETIVKQIDAITTYPWTETVLLYDTCPENVDALVVSVRLNKLNSNLYSFSFSHPYKNEEVRIEMTEKELKKIHKM